MLRSSLRIKIDLRIDFSDTPFATRCSKMPKSRRNGHKKGRTVATRHQGLPGGVRGREWVQNTAVKTLVCTPSPSSWLATPLSSRANRRVDSRGPQSRSASLCGGHPVLRPCPSGPGAASRECAASFAGLLLLQALLAATEQAISSLLLCTPPQQTGESVGGWGGESAVGPGWGSRGAGQRAAGAARGGEGLPARRGGLQRAAPVLREAQAPGTDGTLTPSPARLHPHRRCRRPRCAPPPPAVCATC